MRKILNKVTISGADDQVAYQDMEALSNEFPFMEWGILLSSRAKGSPKYPSIEWMAKLSQRKYDPNFKISGHVCGKWVKDIAEGQWTLVRELMDFFDMFERLQFNFGPATFPLVDSEPFIKGLKNADRQLTRQYILQLPDTTHELVNQCVNAGLDAVPFCDCSCGVGVLPEKWKEAKHPYTGYAGGLSPDNLTENLEKIEQVCGPGPIWIDVETNVRNDKNELDIGLVRRFLETAKPWII